MPGLESLMVAVGAEIENCEEEVFTLFCHTPSCQDLGFIDSSATLLEVTVGSHDFLIHQSPTILSSERCGGTTGAVVWTVAPLFATWISQTSNLLFKNDILNTKSSIIELGCGISGITALALRPLVGSYLLTDQIYVMKLLNQNLEENSNTKAAKFPMKKSKGRNTDSCKKNMRDTRALNHVSNISAIPLDWETDEVTHQLSEGSQSKGFDVLVATDCIYNDTLIQPFVNTCADACKLRYQANAMPTICIIAQQLRSSEVFEKWLKSFHQKFRVWRVPDSELIAGMRMGSGFVVHLGIPR